MIYEALSEEECYLYALMQDESGIDLAEFLLIDDTKLDEETGEQGDGCFRAYPFQVAWWRNKSQRQITAAGRSVGKSLSVKLRVFAFPFLHTGEEMVVTAPESRHLDALTTNIENLFDHNKLAKEMLVSGRKGIKHRTFKILFANGCHLEGIIPQRDGRGLKGSMEAGSLTLTRDRGFIPIEEVVAGDYVWSHERKWNKVLDTYSTRREGYRIKGQGGFEMNVSDNHRFYARNDESKMPGKTKRDLGGFTWEWSDDLTSSKYCPINAYWTGCTDFGEELEIPSIDYSSCKTSFEMDEDFWWLVGRYVADGVVHNRGSAIDLFVHPKDQPEILAVLDRIQASYSIKTRDHSSADRVAVQNSALRRWLYENFGHHSHHKEIPSWCLTMPKEWRMSLLQGYLSGDGGRRFHGKQQRDTFGSASKKLTLGLGSIASTLGYHIGYSTVEIKTDEIMGVKLKNKAADSYACRLNLKGAGLFDKEGYSSYKIRSAESIPEQDFYGLVTEGGSYFAEGVFHHNSHPLILEQDESQDFTAAAWEEIVETVKIQNPAARWRASGVTRGVGDKFDEKASGKESGWKVHRLPALLRPNWDEEEKKQKIEEYGGSVDSIGYRRNVLGLTGDMNAPLFVLSRLLNCTDTDEYSVYNTDEYFYKSIDDALLNESLNIKSLLDFPHNHRDYLDLGARFWIGADLGWTISPTAIVVFAEYKEKNKESTTMRLLNRVLLKRIPAKEQVEAVMHFMDFYRPKSFALDYTGAGQPMYAWLQEETKNSKNAYMLDRLKSYGFSEKVIVGFDDAVEIPDTEDGWKEAAIKRGVIEASTDSIRSLVDNNRLSLPMDQPLLSEFQSVPKNMGMTIDQYGRSTRKVGMHTLDAVRMACLAHSQEAIDIFIANQKADKWQAPAMILV